MKKRGFFGIGIFNWQTEENLGTLWRSANNMGADFLFTVGRTYSHQCSDTTKATKHIPYYSYISLEDFEKHKPIGCITVCVELDKKARSLYTFIHPERTAYILGSEDNGLPKAYLKNKIIVEIPGLKNCLNVSTTGSIVLYDRIRKEMLR